MNDKCEINLGNEFGSVIFWYEALYDFVSTHPHQLSFHQGDRFELLSLVTESEAWWSVKSAHGTIGLVPGNYLQLLDSQAQRLDDDSAVLISGTLSTCEGELRYPDGSTRRIHGGMEFMYGRGLDPANGVKLLDETWLLEEGNFQYPSGAVSTHEGLLCLPDGSLRAPEWELPITARGRPQRIFANMLAEANLASQNNSPVSTKSRPSTLNRSPRSSPRGPPPISSPRGPPPLVSSPQASPSNQSMQSSPQSQTKTIFLSPSRSSRRESLLVVTPRSDVSLHVFQASLQQHLYPQEVSGTPSPDVAVHVLQGTPFSDPRSVSADSSFIITPSRPQPESFIITPSRPQVEPLTIIRPQEFPLRHLDSIPTPNLGLHPAHVERSRRDDPFPAHVQLHVDSGEKKEVSVHVLSSSPVAKGSKYEYWYEAIYEWEPQKAKQLAVRKKDRLTVLQKDGSKPGWWKVSKEGGESGFVPYNYIQLFGPEAKASVGGGRNLLLPSGTISTGKGVIRYPDGSVSMQEGSVRTEKGVKTWQDLQRDAENAKGKLLLDGTILLPDGMIQFPSGAKAEANSQLAQANGGDAQSRWKRFESPVKSPEGDIPLPAENVSAEWKKHQYFLRVLFSFNPVHKGQLSITKGEKLVLVTKNTNHVGWWHVENESGGTGVVPYNFLQLSCQGAMNTFASGALLLKSGAISLKDGSIRYPDGSVFKQQHKVEVSPLPAGHVRLPDGTIRLPSGAFQYPSGAITNAEGLLLFGSRARKPRWKLPTTCLPARVASESYEAVRDFKAQSSSQLSFVKGDRLDIVSKTTKNNGWWRARKSDGTEGVIPCNYLQKPGSPQKKPVLEVKIENKVPELILTTSTSPFAPDRLPVTYFYEAMFEFKSAEKGQLSYQSGDQLSLLSKVPQKNNVSVGWWLMQLHKTREVSRVAFSYVRLSSSHAEQLNQNELLLPSGAISTWLKTGPLIRYPDGVMFSQEDGTYTLNGTVLPPPDTAHLLPDGCTWNEGVIKYPSGAVALPNGQLRYPDRDVSPLWVLPNISRYDFTRPVPPKVLPIEKVDYFYTAVWDNDAENEKQMSYRAGDRLELLNKEAISLDGWWLCQDIHAREGLVAHNFVRLDCDGAVVLEDEADPEVPDVLLLRTGCRSRAPAEEDGGVAIEYPDGSVRFANDALRLPDTRVIPPSEARTFLARGGGVELPDGCYSLADGAIRYPSGAVSTAEGNLQTPEGAIIDPLWPLNTFCDALLVPRNPLPPNLSVQRESPDRNVAKMDASGKRLSQYLKIKPNCYFYESITEFKGDESMLTLRYGQRLVLTAKRADRLWQMRTVDGAEGRVSHNNVQLMYSGIDRDAQGSVLLPTGVISEAGKLRYPDSWETRETESVFFKPDSTAVPSTFEPPPGAVTLLDGVVMLPDGCLRYPSGAVAKTDGSIVGGKHFGPVPVFARDRQPPRRIWQASGAYVCDDTFHYPDGSTMRFGEVVLPSGLTVVQEVLGATSEGGTLLEDGTVRLPSGAIRMPSGAITTALGQLRSRSGTLYPPKWPLPQSAVPSVEAEELALRLLPVLEKGLHHFAQLGDNDTVLRLLNRGISPNRRDGLNNTPLHMTQHFVTAKTLVKHGARNLKNSLGLKATYWCTSLEMKKELKGFQRAYDDQPVVMGDNQFCPKVSKKTKQPNCWACGLPFHARGQRRCHRCGDAVCEMCSRLRFYRPEDYNKKPHRACDSCYNILSFAAASKHMHPPEQHQGSKEIVELKLSCNRLVSHARPSCPLVAVFIRMSSGKYKLIGQTECKIPTRQRRPLQLTFGPREEQEHKRIDPSPMSPKASSKERLIVFDRVLYLDYWPLEDSEMKLAVYETDDVKLTEQSLIGECGVSVREALRITRHSGDVKLELTNKGNKKIAQKMKRENSTLTLIARQLERTNANDVIVMARQVHKPDLSGSVSNYKVGEGGDCTVRLELEVTCSELVEGNRCHRPMVLCSVQPIDQPDLPWSRLQLVWEEPEIKRDAEFAKKCTIFHTHPCNKLLKFEVYDGRSDMKEWVSLGSATTSVYELAGEPNITHVFRVLDSENQMTGGLDVGVQVSGLVDIAASCRNLPKGNAVVAAYDGGEFIAHTECEHDAINPLFLQKLRLEVTPERYVTFSVFHVKNPKKIKLKNMIGSVVVKVADILARTGMFFVYRLETKFEQIPPAVLELRASFLGIPPITLLPQHDPPPFRGSLQKQNGGQYKGWKWRYFVLQGGHLCYYPSEAAMSEKRPKMLFSVLGAKVDMSDVLTAKNSGYQFSILPLKFLPVAESVADRSPVMQEQDKPNVDSDRTYHFQAREEHDRRKWLAALLQHGSHLQVLRDSKSHELPCAYQVAASWLATKD